MTRFLPILLLFLLFVSCSRTSNAGLSDTEAETASVASPTPGTASLPEAKPDTELQKQLERIAAEAKGKVGVYALLIETGAAAGLNADQHFPMQSVYKLPISMAVMQQVEAGKINLEEKAGVAKSDFVSPGQHSPIRDKYPNGTELSVKELIQYAISESDGTASDVLMNLAGGASKVQVYLTSIGADNINVVNSEKEMAQDWQVQYDNWASPQAAVSLLLKMRGWREWKANADDSEQLLTKFMAESLPGAKRLKGLFPPGTPVAHKTGTSGTRGGITAATNDIGVIALPNGKHIAIAVFVSDSRADEKTREGVIAKIAKAAWDKWNR
jgi:beta-lactamase class A